MVCLQITLWLQGLFLFSLVWTVGGTITGDSRKKFDEYFRNLIGGTDPDHPKPKTCKLTKVIKKAKNATKIICFPK
jgi:dynein heavy chain